MPDHAAIYSTYAQTYELLISREDYEHNLLPALLALDSFEEADIVDLGAGTGRLSCLLAPLARSVTSLDASEAMLRVLADKWRRSGFARGTTMMSDHRALPLPDRCADIVTAGWTICYIANANVHGAHENLRDTMAEIERVLRPGGLAIVIETLGTGFAAPQPPSFLETYYAALEHAYGFNRKWIRTDFRFESVEEAERLTRFFFGDELADRVAKERLDIVPGCTGIWWKRVG